MRKGMLLIPLLLASCLSTAINGQCQWSKHAVELRMRWPQRVIQNAPGILEYKRLGISFHVGDYGRGVVEVAVFPLESDMCIREQKVGSFDIVPGIGAYGVLLGWSKAKALRNANQKYTAHQLEQLSGVWCNLDGKRLYIFFSNDKVSMLLASGRFRTPEGITEQSNINDILRTYGQPEKYYEIVSGRHPEWGLIRLLLALGFGLLCGILLARTRRSTRNRIRRMVLAAGLGLATNFTAALLSVMILKAMRQAGPIGIPWPIILVSAMVGGGIGAGVLEVLSVYLIPWSRNVLGLCLVLASVAVATITLGILWPRPDISIVELASLTLINCLFTTSMFLAGRDAQNHT